MLWPAGVNQKASEEWLSHESYWGSLEASFSVPLLCGRPGLPCSTVGIIGARATGMGQLPCTPHCAKCFCIPGQRVLLSPFSRRGSQDFKRLRGICPKSWYTQWNKRTSTLRCLPGWEACALRWGVGRCFPYMYVL